VKYTSHKVLCWSDFAVLFATFSKVVPQCSMMHVLRRGILHTWWWVCWSLVNVLPFPVAFCVVYALQLAALPLPFYTAVCSGSADGMLPCYHFILQCAVGLLTACYRVTILYCSVQWVYWRHVTVLPFYTAVCNGSADGMLPCCHFMLPSLQWVCWRRTTVSYLKFLFAFSSVSGDSL